MKKMLNFFMLILCVFYFLSCESDSSSGVVPGVPTDVTTGDNLEGTWSQADFNWANNGDDGIKGNADDKWDKATVNYNGNTVCFVWDENTGITKPASSIYRITITATYTTGSSVSTPVGAKKINYVYTAATITPLTSDVVTYWNANNTFGYNDWVINVSKDILGRGNMPSAGDIFYDVYKIENDKLYLGDDEIDSNYDGSTDAKRPQVFQDVYVKN